MRKFFAVWFISAKRGAFANEPSLVVEAETKDEALEVAKKSGALEGLPKGSFFAKEIHVILRGE